MNLGSQAMSRQAALLAHAMLPHEREWLLAKLPAVQRTQLQNMLAELCELGIPADRAIVQRTLAQATQAGSAVEKSPVSSAGSPSQFTLASLSAADIALLAELLQDEPAALVARVLQMEDGPWRAALTSRLGELQKLQVKTELHHRARKSAPALDRALLNALGKGVEHLRAQKYAGAPPRGGRRMLVSFGWLKKSAASSAASPASEDRHG